MSFTRRTVVLIIAAAFSALIIPWQVAGVVMLVVLVAAAADALQVRTPPMIERSAPQIMSRGVPSELACRVRSGSSRMLVKQPVGDADLLVAEQVGVRGLESALLARRRGAHLLPRLATISTGPLGLGRWYHRVGEDSTVTVYPDLPAARRLALDVRLGRFRDDARRARGQLGLGTDLESIRDYQPDDDIRQVNWKATARIGSPMSNTYRVEQDRQIMCLVDCGRLMAAPVTANDEVSKITRLDVAVDVVAAVTAVAKEVGDQVGVLAFTDEIIRMVSPRRDSEDVVLEAIHDLEPVGVDADYERAFQRVISMKRSLVIVLTDLLDDTAGEPLVRSLPILARKHSVIVASLSDPDVERLISTPATSIDEAAQTAVAVDILEPRSLLVSRLTHRGIDVVEGDVHRLSARTVAAYLRAKRRART
jgi:uncharacterized protein (DUF58 family)